MLILWIFQIPQVLRVSLEAGGDIILENLEALTLGLPHKPGLILLSVTDRKDRGNHHSLSRPTGMGKVIRGKSLGKASGQVWQLTLLLCVPYCLPRANACVPTGAWGQLRTSVS